MKKQAKSLINLKEKQILKKDLSTIKGGAINAFMKINGPDINGGSSNK